jgi:hypothetical protein
MPPALSLENRSWGFLGVSFLAQLIDLLLEHWNGLVFPWCALGDARQRVPCAISVTNALHYIVSLGFSLRRRRRG